LKAGENLIVIDARSSSAFNAEHILNSVHFPHQLMNTESTAHFDKSALYVTYCDGIGFNASTKGALVALTKICFNIKELIGGIEWWKRDGYPTSTVSSGENTNCGCA
jgi:rhodanese-related sulfurtransferase